MAPKVNKLTVKDKDPSIYGAKEAAQKSASELVNFSFKYLQEESNKFPCYLDETVHYYFEILKRLKAVCTLKTMEVYTNRSSALRIHPITWNQTSEERFGIPAEDQIVDTPYQISLSANEYGRLHGFFISNTFYVVWFDKDHKLYPAK